VDRKLSGRYGQTWHHVDTELCGSGSCLWPSQQGKTGSWRLLVVFLQWLSMGITLPVLSWPVLVDRRCGRPAYAQCAEQRWPLCQCLVKAVTWAAAGLTRQHVCHKGRNLSGACMQDPKRIVGSYLTAQQFAS
jgi:hypothetical protein